MNSQDHPGSGHEPCGKYAWRRKTYIEPEYDALLVCDAPVLDQDEEEVGGDFICSESGGVVF
jgi:hypothetical protein